MNEPMGGFNSEFVFKTSRSGGKGGQNVNKVSSKVELDFDVLNSTLLNSQQKSIILEKLDSRISKEGILQVVMQTERSQLANKQLAIKKFYELLKQCFVKKKKRVPTKTPRSVKEKRLKNKKINSERKKDRQKH